MHSKRTIRCNHDTLTLIAKSYNCNEYKCSGMYIFLYIFCLRNLSMCRLVLQE